MRGFSRTNLERRKAKGSTGEGATQIRQLRGRQGQAEQYILRGETEATSVDSNPSCSETRCLRPVYQILRHSKLRLCRSPVFSSRAVTESSCSKLCTPCRLVSKHRGPKWLPQATNSHLLGQCAATRLPAFVRFPEKIL